MADLLLDTDVFVDHLRGFAPLKIGANRVHYSVVTRAELIAGSSATDAVTALLEPLREIPVDRAIAQRAGRIRRESSVAMPDALIAATALEHRLTVVTRNQKDFERIRGVRVRAPR